MPAVGTAGPAWKRVPGQQADGLLQEGELWVVEAEDLVHHVGLQLHSQAEHGEGLAVACAEQNLPGEQLVQHQDAHEGCGQLRARCLPGRTGTGSPWGPLTPTKWEGQAWSEARGLQP